MIPRKIHQIWWQGSDNLPNEYRANAARLKELNPSWEYKLWDRHELERHCALLGEDVLAAFKGYSHMHQKIDLGRQVILFHHGGVSIDTDISAHRSLDETPGLHEASMIISRSAVSPLYLAVFSRGRLKTACNNSVVMVEPSSPIIKSVIREMVQAAGYTSFLTYLTVQWTTGPFLFTTAINGAVDSDQVVVLPPEYFECGKHHPDAIVSHHHHNSWLPAWFALLNMGFARLWQWTDAVSP